MNRINWTTTLALLLSGLASAAPAAETPEAPSAPAATPAPAAPAASPAAEQWLQLHEARAAAYEQALQSAEASQREALAAVEAARRELEAQAQAQAAEQDRATADGPASEAQAEQLHREAAERKRVIEQELERAHENLRRATREVTRVHREVIRPPRPPAPPAPGALAFAFASSDRPVIGVILGDAQSDGVPVLGVSPDGPADRAGLEPGDLIVSVMGQPLAGGEGDTRAVLSASLKDIKVGDELQIGVEREGATREFTVTVAKREPYTWHGLSRLATAPTPAVDAMRFVERIELPEIDREQLDAELAQLREQMDVLRTTSGDTVMAFSDGEFLQDFEFEYEEFSDFGDSVIAGAGVWFGMPLTRGIKMTELDAGLGEYFDSDRGVLVLKAEEDNGLQLQAGDVILKVDGTEVVTPGDVMRALREVDSGAQVDIDIKRERKNHTLKVDVPETRVGVLLGNGSSLLPAPPAPPAPATPPPAVNP